MGKNSRHIRIAVGLPRRMFFGPAFSTSIDLCVRDLVTHSAFHQDTAVFGEPVDVPFPDIDFRPVPRNRYRGHSGYARRLAGEFGRFAPDIIVVHQHVPSAVRIAAALPHIPVVLYRHNDTKPPANFFHRLYRERNYARFRAIVFVSHFIHERFIRCYPQLAPHTRCIHNGLDFSAWNPTSKRARQVLFVGRATPSKGAVKSAHAIAESFARTSGWTARFIVARTDHDDAYLDTLKAALSPLGERATLEYGLPHDVVKSAFETAAIALVPSRSYEPFGRTAIEAFAGGAALMCSMRGGLREVADGIAIEIDPDDVTGFASALDNLMRDEAGRMELSASANSRARTLFDIRQSAGQLDRLLAQLVATAPRKR